MRASFRRNRTHSVFHGGTFFNKPALQPQGGGRWLKGWILQLTEHPTSITIKKKNSFHTLGLLFLKCFSHLNDYRLGGKRTHA